LTINKYISDNKSETDLVIAIRDGDIKAFNDLFDKYAKRLYKFSVMYLKSKEDAEEIVQEVFLKIWDNRENLSTLKSLEAYLFTIAKNGILNLIRKSKSEEVYMNYIKIHPGKNVLLDEELDFKELERIYKEAVENLSPKRKEIFQLSREEHLSNMEIAEKMDISIKTVENQMTSALTEIRKKLRSLGFPGLIFIGLFINLN
jgi:RNA polymerase sigma-70 factor, ECF subfamily